MTVVGTVPDLGTGLARFLAHVFDRPITVSNLAQSSAGARRANVLFDAHDGERLLRLVATVLPTSEIEINPIAAEAAVRTVAEQHGVPVPHIHAVCTDPAYVGGPFFVSDRVDGESVPRRVLRLVHQEGIGEPVARQLGEALGRLHAIDPALAPEELAGAGDTNPAEVALTDADAGVRELLPNRPVFALGLRWLERRLPAPPARRTIVHTDARNGNLIVGADGLRAVLDWEGARRLGDPMQDMAWPALRMWRFREDEREIGGFAGREPFVAGYEAAGGQFDVERFEWWKVLGTLRWGLGLAGQADAHLDGRFPSVVMAASGRRVPELEWDLLMLLRP
ncbi:MAG TPA: phosphotransferase family protein [Acidimicrobiales bacterium]|nr:phosphotransferase family protein [Acidimicrobiales bacterium]